MILRVLYFVVDICITVDRELTPPDTHINQSVLCCSGISSTQGFLLALTSSDFFKALFYSSIYFTYSFYFSDTFNIFANALLHF